MFEFIVVICLVLCNAFLVVSELSLLATKKPRLKAMADDGIAKAKLAYDLAENPYSIIVTAQIGLTVLMLIEGAVTENLMKPLVDPLVVWLPELASYAHIITVASSFIFVTILTILFGDIIPKRIALVYPESIAIKLAKANSRVIFVTTPLVKAFSYVSDRILTVFGVPTDKKTYVSAEDIEDLFEAGAQSGLLDKTEKDLLDNVWRMDERSVGALMTPRADIVYIDITATDEENLDKILDNPFKQIVVCNENLDHVLGVGQAGEWLKDIVKQMTIKVAKPKISWTTNLSPIHAIPNSLSLIETLDSFRQYKTHIALVYNEFGHVEGMISVNDLMSSVIGEYPGDNNEDLLIIKDESGKWLIDGMASIDDVKQALEIDTGDEDDDQITHYNTAAGLALAMVGKTKGRLPKEFDRFDYAGYAFEVVDIDRSQGYKIDRLMVKAIETDTSSNKE